MQIIFTVLRYLTTKQMSEQRLNGMVTPTILNFGIFHFVLIWYDKEWELISKKYDFTLGGSFSLQKVDFKTWKIETISHQIYWDNQPPSPLFNQCWWVYKLHRDIAVDKLLTNHMIPWYRERPGRLKPIWTGVFEGLLRTGGGGLTHLNISGYTCLLLIKLGGYIKQTKLKSLT